MHVCAVLHSTSPRANNRSSQSRIEESVCVLTCVAVCAVVFIRIKTRARVVSLFAGDIKNSRPPVWCCCPNTIGGRLFRSVAEKEGRIVRQIWNTLAFQGKKEKENLTLPPKARPVVPVPPSSACACVSITKQCGGSENKKRSTRI